MTLWILKLSCVHQDILLSTVETFHRCNDRYSFGVLDVYGTCLELCSITVVIILFVCISEHCDHCFRDKIGPPVDLLLLQGYDSM